MAAIEMNLQEVQALYGLLGDFAINSRRWLRPAGWMSGGIFVDDDDYQHLLNVGRKLQVIMEDNHGKTVETVD